MESAANPIIVILGQTASGKSQLALDVARQFNGEIIAADSRTVYKGMDIGTAKPTEAEQALVPHFGLDLVYPNESFSAAQFQQYARDTVADIQSRKKLPIIVGGSGLYIDGFVYNFSFQKQPDLSLRHELAGLSLEQLQQRARAIGITHDEVSFTNPRHLSRAIERAGVAGSRQHQTPHNVLLIGLRVQKDVLDERINDRVGTMFDNGLVDEVQKLIQVYGSDAPGLLAPGYKAVIQYLNGSLTLDEAKELFARNDRRLAKRQLTWFKRNPDIIWCTDSTQATDKIGAFLSEFDTIHA